MICIKHCLESLWNNYNCNHNYPVYVYYFDDIYDSLDLQKDIIGDTRQNVVFKTVPYKTPDFIPENELYYNRKDIQYVNTSFSINRKGYLHMCNFTSNIYGYQNTELEKYDFIMTHDDESGYTKMMDYDPFDIIEESGAWFGAYSFGQRLNNGKPHQGHLDTRVGLYKFTKLFMDDNSEEIITNLLRIGESIGDVMEETRKALNDDKVDDEEKEKIASEVMRLEKKISELKLKLDLGEKTDYSKAPKREF